ncbi:MAG: TIGR00730 family Rossman fold protein [Crocinitomicaceae bacterium]|nr:TIGR00730 family Rossman fold protein [Crocinitomicaceae bacterium]
MKDTSLKEEISFLKGARTRWREFKYTISIVIQFVKGFRKMHFLGPTITVFGSARFNEDESYYIKARELSAKLAAEGFAIMTGGGPGIMEAANRGAKDVCGISVGCNIVLPHEQKENPYLDTFITFDSFFVRKELLRKYSFAFIIFPGGFGTLDETFETITLIQTGKMEKLPLVVMDKEFHKNIIEHIEVMKEEGTISPEDEKLFLFTDDVEEAFDYIIKYAKEHKGIKLREVKPIRMLGEDSLRNCK